MSTDPESFRDRSESNHQPIQLSTADRTSSTPVRKDDEWVYPEPREWVTSPVDVELVPGKPNRVEVVATRGALIQGKVIHKDTEEPASSGSLNITHSGLAPEDSPLRARLNDKGEFTARVPAGKVTVSLSYCRIGDESISFDYPEETDTPPPSVSRVVADAQVVSDVVLRVTPPVLLYKASNRPVPAGFTVTPGTYDLIWDPNANASGDAWAITKYRDDKAKSRILKLPPLKSTKPLCCAFQLDSEEDDGLLYAVFDESKGTGRGYDTAYVDTNRNRDLSGETPITWKQKSHATTPWQLVSARQGRGPDSSKHPLRVRWRLDSSRPYRMERRGAWRGKLRSSSGRIDVILLDWNANGAYNERAIAAATQMPSIGRTTIGGTAHSPTRPAAERPYRSSGVHTACPRARSRTWAERSTP